MQAVYHRGRSLYHLARGKSLGAARREVIDQCDQGHGQTECLSMSIELSCESFGLQGVGQRRACGSPAGAKIKAVGILGGMNPLLSCSPRTSVHQRFFYLPLHTPRLLNFFPEEKTHLLSLCAALATSKLSVRRILYIYIYTRLSILLLAVIILACRSTPPSTISFCIFVNNPFLTSSTLVFPKESRTIFANLSSSNNPLTDVLFGLSPAFVPPYCSLLPTRNPWLFSCNVFNVLRRSCDLLAFFHNSRI